MKAFLNYEYMITPGVLKILSYISMAVAVIVGLVTAFTADPISGIGITVLGPIVIRIYAELMLIVFEIHRELRKISEK
jgi:uncharacterized membrane protein